MSTPTLDTRPDGALVIEADTAEKALAEVGARLGPDAEIVSAEKVHRGGFKGFFAREVVQLVARERGATTAADGDPALGATSVDAPADEVEGGLAAMLARMTDAADEQEGTFHDVLARQFAVTGAAVGAPGPRIEPAVTVPVPPAPEPVVGAESVPAESVPAESVPAESVPSASASIDPATVEPVATEPVMAEPTVPAEPTVVTLPAAARPPSTGPGSVAWHVDELRDLRVPASIVAACEHLDPADDTAWVLAIAAAVGSWCRPLPQGNSILAGPRAHRLGAALQVKLAEGGKPVGRARSVALRITDGAQGRGHLAQARGSRWGHLVVGGARWQGLLLEDVSAVSWVGDEALPDALEAASRLGLVLGYGLGDATGKTPVRATPLEIALIIRSLLPRTTA